MEDEKGPPNTARELTNGNASSEPEVVERNVHTLSGRTYLAGFKLTVIVFGLCLSVFCTALDNTIVATAVPRITDDFNSLQDVGWYGSAYLLTTSTFQLFYGKLYSQFSIKTVYLCAVSIFELGSLICGVAPSSTVLIVGRAIAGTGAAGIFSGAVTVIGHSVPLQKQPIYIALTGAMYGIASVLGPLIGGAFTDHVTWRWYRAFVKTYQQRLSQWCFYLNLPIGAVTIVVIFFFLKLKAPSCGQEEKLGFLKGIRRLDPIGTCLFIPSQICLLLALQWGGTTYAWNSGRIVALLTIFATLLVAFVGVQIWLGDEATIPPRIVAQRTIVSASLFAFLLAAAFFLLNYFLPLWFQAIKGTSALQSGIDSIPLVLTFTISMMCSGMLTTKFGHYMPYVIACPVFISIGTGLMMTFTPETGSGKWIGYQVIFGIGGGMAFQIPQIAAQTVLPLKDVAQGASIPYFFQTLGGTLLVSVGNNILNTRLIENIGALQIPNVDPHTLIQLGATKLRGYVPSDYLSRILVAYNLALVDVFRLATILATLSVIGAAGIEWKSVHDPVGKPEDEEHVPVDGSTK